VHLAAFASNAVKEVWVKATMKVSSPVIADRSLIKVRWEVLFTGVGKEREVAEITTGGNQSVRNTTKKRSIKEWLVGDKGRVYR
jgi:hypothetical protein